MEFKKCERCGNFFISSNKICGNCASKDNLEISTLRNYFDENEVAPSFHALAQTTGISEKNLTRYLQENQFIENQNEIFDLPTNTK